MKILQVSASYKPAFIYGGPTMSVSKLSEELLIGGEQVTVYTTLANGLSELEFEPGKERKVDGVSVTYFKRITKDHTHFSPSLLNRLQKTLHEYDVVHIHAWWNLISIFSCLVAVIKKKPVILSPRGTLSNYSFHNRSSLIKRLIHSFLGKRSS